MLIRTFVMEVTRPRSCTVAARLLHLTRISSTCFRRNQTREDTSSRTIKKSGGNNSMRIKLLALQMCTVGLVILPVVATAQNADKDKLIAIEQEYAAPAPPP